MNDEVRLYEGLVRATANVILTIAPTVELSREDIEQRLRIKVWRALDTWSPAWNRPVDKYVVNCVFNEKKDILDLKRRGEIALDSILLAPGEGGDHSKPSQYEQERLAVSAEQVFASVEEDDLQLPSTLTSLELRVVLLLYVQRYQTEIAIELGLSKGEMERTMRSIRAKLADWRPSAAERESVLPTPLRPLEQQQVPRAA